MRLVLFAALAGLTACATVEERTDRNAGSGLTQGSLAASGASQPGSASSAEFAMTAPQKAPQFAVTSSGASGNRTEAAELAASYETNPEGVSVMLGGQPYWLRQVRANSIEFAVAEPQGKPGAISGSQALAGETAARISCLLTGESWTFDGVLVAGLNCS